MKGQTNVSLEHEGRAGAGKEPGSRLGQIVNRPKPPGKTKHLLTLVIIFLLLWASAKQTGAGVTELFTGFPEMWKPLKEMFPPRWSYFDNIVQGMLETIRMALLGTTIGAIFAIPISILCAGNLAPSRWIYYPARLPLNLIRTIPDLPLAALFVAVFGLGPVPGILALAVFSLGLIAKLTYETLETIDKGPLEAMTAVGMNRIQLIVYGVVPQLVASSRPMCCMPSRLMYVPRLFLAWSVRAGLGFIMKRRSDSWSTTRRIPLLFSH